MSFVHKFRPDDLDSVIGQDFVKSAIAGMFRRNVLHPVLIFHGDRGCGKTTMARIVAKHYAANSLDITEIDAASNNGVDFVRDLVGQTQFASIGGGYKIYIIDEAHQLTKQANNALLKTLEEPGAKTAFIFCTTEVQKILPTVRSRAQVFKFTPVAIEQIVNRLKSIRDAESIDVSDDLLDAIARANNGIVRESITDLDQISLISNPSIAQYYEMKGKSDVSTVAGVLNAVLQSDYLALRKALKLVDDPIEMLSDLCNFLSNVIPSQKKEYSLQTCDRATFAEAGKWGKDVLDSTVFTLLIGMQKASLSFDAVKNPKVYLESVLLDLSLIINGTNHGVNHNNVSVHSSQSASISSTGLTLPQIIDTLSQHLSCRQIFKLATAQLINNTLIVQLPSEKSQFRGNIEAILKSAIATSNLSINVSVSV